MHGGDREVARLQLVSEPIDFSTGVAEDDGLCDCDSLVEIGEGIQLPILLLDGNVELFDTFEGQFVLLDEDSHGIAHELGGNFEDVLWHGSGEKNDLGGLREELEDVVDLLGEAALR